VYLCTYGRLALPSFTMASAALLAVTNPENDPFGVEPKCYSS
jgi:hypothetical protein